MRHELALASMAHLVDGPMHGPLAEHVRQCLRCQVEEARYRRVRRALRDLPPPAVPPDLLSQLLGGLHATWETEARAEEARLELASVASRWPVGRAAVVAGGLGVAGVVGAFVVTRVRSRLAA